MRSRDYHLLQQLFPLYCKLSGEVCSITLVSAFAYDYILLGAHVSLFAQIAAYVDGNTERVKHLNTRVGWNLNYLVRNSNDGDNNNNE